MTEEARSSREDAVETWLRSAPDDRVLLIAELCSLTEQTDDRVVGEIKRNEPSYRVAEHFATTGLERKGGIRLVLHAGATERGMRVEERERRGLSLRDG